METKTHVALVSIPAFSHQVSILEFAKRLVHHHPDFHVTCIIPTIGSPPSASLPFLRALPPSIDHVFLPPVSSHDLLAETTSLQVQLQLAVSRSIPLVREALSSLVASTKNLAAMVVDPFANEVIQVARELNILSYIYFPSSAMLLSLCLYSSKLDEKVVVTNCEFRELPGLIEIPGCVPVRGIDLPDNLQDRTDLAYKQFLQRCKRYRLADGFLVNSFVEMEAGPLKSLQEEGSFQHLASQDEEAPNVYPVGPIIQTGPTNQASGSDCLRWLDLQPRNSVLYISFGSGGSLSEDQINELALGLELSNVRFLWVNVKAPSNKASASYLKTPENDHLESFLPKGFLERTKERGLVLTSWAPQVEVLGHEATGAFLTHCGWNSVLESVVNGVPMIAWPLFAEQRTNAAMLVDGLKVAVRSSSQVGDDDGLVEKKGIAKVIKSVIEGKEGKEVRRRMKKLKNAAADAVMEDGSSAKTLSSLTMKWKKLRREI
ncbi:hydroquinone glucosyltransferase-like isoform X2 [Prosopis cineraria]|uniref:hydroquinone glucosyltransferase-like isoform X2 n=1 Tax=Prosopis cineraria TaxID=364024 RepID=UPI00240EBF0A|nr:hydroquinone glucosyltransferase-like isoform X2 [Prosopis cineraria]